MALTGWSNRIKIIIDKTKIDSTLYNFPILIKLSNLCGTGSFNAAQVFNELVSDSNRKKIAITTSDEETQCYVEIESWNTTTEDAILWTKVPEVSSSSDTVLYLHYDSTQSDNTSYVGDTGDTARCLAFSTRSLRWS
jgi:hypothetical protein